MVGNANGPVRAPGHAENIKGTPGKWSLRFGANTFEISLAIRGCCGCVNRWRAKRPRPEDPQSLYMLRKEMTAVILGAVRNHSGKLYDQYGNNTRMTAFGVQGIDLWDFVRSLAIRLGVPQIAIFPGKDV
ncbi:MAG: hypothetical protein IT437_07450 [Phycisphaerales bacterium]|nr:hypothetical protein [Phycisphaerales bacterium]